MNVYKNRIIAAVRNEDDFDRALSSSADIIFELAPNIITLGYEVKKAHEHNKKLYIHIDLAEGIAGDKYGILYVKDLGADGIISTRTNMIKTAHNAGLDTVQRFFVVDSHFLDTTLETVKASKANMIEIMPGTVGKVIRRLKDRLGIPIIAGGLVETREEIDSAFENGAAAVSTGACELWNL